MLGVLELLLLWASMSFPVNRFRTESTVQAFVNVYKRGGGVSAFWAGLGPKLVESATKGALLLAAKESIYRTMVTSGFGTTLSGIVAGAGGGVAQVIVMGPCTFLVTGNFLRKPSEL